MACNRAFYVQAGHQREVERLGGVADQQYLTAYNYANAAIVKLEEAAKQDTRGNRAAELAAWDDGLANIHQTMDAFASILDTERSMLQLLDKYGPEPGFEQALRSLDPNTVATKLIGEKVVPNNPEEIRAMVEYVHKDGARGLITGRMQGIQALHDAAVQWEKVVREGRPAAAQGEILARIDGAGFPPTKASQQMLRALADNLSAACSGYAYISKIARGTLGW